MSTAEALAYAYTGGNGYAYAYTGGNAYAYSGPMESYGFDGFPGNPMLATGLLSTRAAIRRDIFNPVLDGLRDVGALRIFGDPVNGLPATESAADIGRYGSQVRTSMALLELMSSVSFAFDPNTRFAGLWGSWQNGNQVALSPLVTMRRPSRDYFNAQLRMVDSWSPTRDSRLPEILTQVAPPLAYFASIMNLQNGRHRHTLELINTSLQFGYAICMRFKHALACPRPSEYSAALLPVLEVPPHRTLPAGHAQEAHITATLLSELAGFAGATEPHRALRRLAHRIAENRVVAGLHFPIDNIAGRLMGDALADYLLAAAGQRNVWTGGSFDGEGLAAGAAAEDELRDEDSSADSRAACNGCGALVPAAAAPPLPIFQQLWVNARAEWDR